MAIKIITKPGGRMDGHRENVNKEVEYRKKGPNRSHRAENTVTELKTHRGVQQQTT